MRHSVVIQLPIWSTLSCVLPVSQLVAGSVRSKIIRILHAVSSSYAESHTRAQILTLESSMTPHFRLTKVFQLYRNAKIQQCFTKSLEVHSIAMLGERTLNWPLSLQDTSNMHPLVGVMHMPFSSFETQSLQT